MSEPLFPYMNKSDKGNYTFIYTNRVKREDLSKLESVKVAPCIFQEYIAKKVELRITVVGHKVFATEIHSQNSDRSRDDWRRFDFENTPYNVHKLPAGLEEQCRQLSTSANEMRYYERSRSLPLPVL
jgi:hypothetical protein